MRDTCALYNARANRKLDTRARHVPKINPVYSSLRASYGKEWKCQLRKRMNGKNKRQDAWHLSSLSNSRVHWTVVLTIGLSMNYNFSGTFNLYHCICNMTYISLFTKKINFWYFHDNFWDFHHFTFSIINPGEYVYVNLYCVKSYYFLIY